MNVYQKLQKLRVELQNMDIKKSGRNKFAGYDYYELKDFLPTINKMCLENDLFTLVTFTAEEAVLQIINSENVEEKIFFHSPMATADLKGCHAIQNIGAVETYQRRYLYVTAFEIVEHDALDSTTGATDSKQSNTTKSSANKQGYKLSDAQINRMYAIAKSKGVTPEQVVSKILKDYGCKPADMSKQQYDEKVAGLEAMESKK